MAVYHTNKDCSRILYLGSVDSIESIEFEYTFDGFDQIIHEWSYSLDQSSWSNWVDKESLLSTLSSLPFNGSSIYIRLKLEIRSTSTSQNFTSYSLDEIKINGDDAIIDHMEMVNLSPILITNTHKNLFNPYRQSDQQKELYDKLSKSTNDIFGFECIYFRTEPKHNSKDITFKSYKLHEVIEYKDLKVTIADNEIPTDRLIFSALDIDFQDELEIHIVKEVFNEVFGEGLEPNSNDFLYLPLTDRMYQLNTKQNGDLFFNHSPYWRAFLVKYEDRANVQKSGEQFDRIEELVDFEKDFENEATQLEKDDAVKAFNNPKSDSRQNYISDDKLLTNNGEVVQWMYNYLRTEQTPQYTYDISLLSNDQWSFFAWFKVNDLTNDMVHLKDIDDSICANLKVVNGDIQLKLGDDITGVTMIPTTINPMNEINEDEFIGIVVNYANTETLSMSTISVYNARLELVAEYAEGNPPELPNLISMDIIGGIGYANLRVGSKFIAKTEMNQKLQENLPSLEEYIIVDNAMPDLEEPRY
jgi:hypothetical protein